MMVARLGIHREELVLDPKGRRTPRLDLMRLRKGERQLAEPGE
jgi:hypothetical protein